MAREIDTAGASFVERYAHPGDDPAQATYATRFVGTVNERGQGRFGSCLGQVVGAKTVVNTESHQIIEEFMLAANEAVASIMANKGWPFLRRIHANPDPRRLKQLTEFVTELGIETESLESRFELQRVLAAVQGKPEQHAVNYAMLRSLQQAVYSPREEGHYALASECYCHFTSPIRRYPDLTIHRLVRAMVTDAKLANDFAMLEVQGEHCSDRERRAEAAERELTKLKLLGFMSERIGQTMPAVITGVEDFGLFVQGLEIPAEGLLHSTALHDDYYDFDRTTHTLTVVVLARHIDSVIRSKS